MEQLPDSDELFDMAFPAAGNLASRPHPGLEPEPDLASAADSVPEPDGWPSSAAAQEQAAPPVQLIPAPVAVPPQEATQSWDASQDWEREQPPDEDRSWPEGRPWQEGSAWQEGGAWHEAGAWPEAGAPEAVPLPTRVPLSGLNVGRAYAEPPRTAARPSAVLPPAPEPEYREPEYREPEYREPEYREPEYREPEYGQSEYGQSEYGQPEYREAGYREPEYAQPEYPEAENAGETSASLTSESLLHGKRAAPGSGWRRGVYRATGGLLRFGESAAEMRRRDLINRVRTPVAGGHHRVAVLSLKGGVGKTTTAVGLGATLATLRGDRVIAVDANPDRGTLSDKVRLETSATIRDLLNERGQVGRYADVRAFTSQAPSRLEVLASDRDPAVSVAFGAEDYSDVAQVLEHFYSICITDCGTGLLHSAMSGVLSLADQIILVSSPSVDGARSASATLDWLEAHGCGDLVRNGVVVLSAIRPKSKSTVDIDRLEHHFAARCRAVARIPYDPHLEEGAEIELELLSSETAEAYLSLAAVVGDGLAWSRRMTSQSGVP
jgi:MinD-like ATPase involved in chromosome partitioning or flagellar assembly